MNRTENLIRRAKKAEHGFLGIQKAADEIVDERPVEGSFHLANELFTSAVYHARSLATFMLEQMVCLPGTLPIGKLNKLINLRISFCKRRRRNNRINEGCLVLYSLNRGLHRPIFLK